jgi:predicted Zn-dependent protease
MTDHETAKHLAAIALQMLRHGQAEDALALLNSAAELAPDDRATIALQCEAAHRAGQHAQAHARLAVLLPLVPEAELRALRTLDAMALLALGRRAEAQSVYRAGEPTAVTDTGE